MRLALFACLALILGACTPSDSWQKEANQALVNRERGLNEKNLQLYLSSVSKQYGNDATGYTRIETRAQTLFGTIDKIRYTSSERSLYQEDGRIRAVQRFAMDLERDGKTKSLSGQEQLFIIQDADGKYRIVDGL